MSECHKVGLSVSKHLWRITEVRTILEELDDSYHLRQHWYDWGNNATGEGDRLRAVCVLSFGGMFSGWPRFSLLLDEVPTAEAYPRLLQTITRIETVIPKYIVTIMPEAMEIPHVRDAYHMFQHVLPFLLFVGVRSPDEIAQAWADFVEKKVYSLWTIGSCKDGKAEIKILENDDLNPTGRVQYLLYKLKSAIEEGFGEGSLTLCALKDEFLTEKEVTE